MSRRKPATRAGVEELTASGARRHEDRLATEEPLEIRLAWPGAPARRVWVTMRTPGHDFELAAGWVVHEGLARSIGTIAYCTDEDLTPQQRNTVIASYLGWTLDAFDFFILVFVLKYIAEEFHTDVPAVSVAIFLTLAMRALGALIFGLAADRYGRRITLMADVLLYSLFEFLTGFSTGLTMFLVLRALYGIAMGGEWGVGASLVMETVPEESRGIVS